MPLQRTFKDHFKNLPSNEGANSHASGFLKASSVESTNEQKERFISEKEVVFAVPMNNGKARILHSTTILGGSLHRPGDSRIFSLTGMGSNAVAVVVDKETLFKVNKYNGPTAEEMKQCLNIDALRSLETEGTTGVQTRNALAAASTEELEGLLALAPFALDVLCSEAEGSEFDTMDMILPILDAAKRQDQLNENDEASKYAEEAVKWLWAVANGQIDEVKLGICSDDNEMEECRRKRHGDCIMPPVENNLVARGSDRQLIETLTRTNEVSMRQTDMFASHYQRLAEKDAIAKDKFSKLTEQTQRMIRNASSKDGERPSNPSETTKAFFDSESEGKADTIFMQQMKSLGSGQAAISSSVTSSLHKGFLTWSGETPNNLSVFSFSTQTPGQGDSNRGEVMHLISMQGKRKTANEIKESMLQSIKIASNFDEMMRQITYWKDGLVIILGAESLVVTQINRLRASISKGEGTFRLRIHNDGKFISMFLYGVDVRVQRWLEECKEALDREDVRDDLINFDNIVDSVLDGTFQIALPSCFKSDERKKTKTGDVASHHASYNSDSD